MFFDIYIPIVPGLAQNLYDFCSLDEPKTPICLKKPVCPAYVVNIENP